MKKKYRVSVQYSIEIEANTQAGAMYEVQYASFCSNDSVRHLRMSIIREEDIPTKTPAPEPVDATYNVKEALIDAVTATTDITF